MPRFVSIALASVLFAAPVQAQVAKDRVPPPGRSAKKASPSAASTSSMTRFDIDGSSGKGSRIIAGTEVMANTSVGFGMFGEKAERPDHARSTNRDYSVPKSRKAAFGVALRF